MRVVVKKRILFFVLTIIIYILGFQFIPEKFKYDGSFGTVAPLVIATFGYFILVPILYWFLIIKAGGQKAWKLLIILSISSLCARYSFPESIGEYFEFVAWVRYPIIAVVLVIEFYLMWAIINGLWQARKLSGDPRVHVWKKYKDDDKKLALALPLAWEPASWYYAIPKFSKKHQKPVGHLQFVSASRYHWLSLTVLFIILSGLSYHFLVDWSEVAAVFVSSLLIYSIIFITANYRIARYHSIYIIDDQLIVNDAFFGFMVINIYQIKKVEVENENAEQKNEGSEILIFGNNKANSVILNFISEQSYLGLLGISNEPTRQVRLNVDDPEQFMLCLS